MRPFAYETVTRQRKTSRTFAHLTKMFSVFKGEVLVNVEVSLALSQCVDVNCPYSDEDGHCDVERDRTQHHTSNLARTLNHSKRVK